MVKKFYSTKINIRFLIAAALLAVVLLLFLWNAIRNTNTAIRSTEALYQNRFKQLKHLMNSSVYAYEMSYSITLSQHNDIRYNTQRLLKETNKISNSIDAITEEFAAIEKLIHSQGAEKYLFFETFRHNLSLIKKNVQQFDDAIEENDNKKAAEVFLNQFLLNFNNLTNAIDRLTKITNAEIETDYERIIEMQQQAKNEAIVYYFLSVFIILSLGFLLSRGLVKRLSEIKNSMSSIVLGNLGSNIGKIEGNDEIAQIQKQLKVLVKNLNRSATFAYKIAENNLDEQFTPLSENDMLGNSLIAMRQNLKRAIVETEQRKAREEKQNWINTGIARFGDILRQRQEDIEELGYRIIQNLVNYLGVQQGGLFIYNDDKKDNSYLDLIAAYAYNRRKYLDNKILIGEGLVGTCAEELKASYISEIPEDYMYIDSGFGKTPPRYLLLVPLVLDEQLFGVIELASLNEIPKYRIEFTGKIAETIAATLNNVKISKQTEKLLIESKQKTEAMSSQEEEMRQNLEELTATQEELQRKNDENEKMVADMRKNETQLLKELNQSNKKEKELQERIKLLNDELKSIKNLKNSNI